MVSETPVHRMHISRRSSGIHQGGGLHYSGGESSGRLVGLGLEHSNSSESSHSRRSSPSNSNSYSSSPSSGGGDYEWASVSTQHERERGHMHQPTSSRNTPVKDNNRAYLEQDIPWKPFGTNWTPEKAKPPLPQMYDIPSIATLRQDDISPFRLQSSPFNLCRSHSSPSHLDEYESQPLSASTSRASTSYRNISPSPSLSSLSRLPLDPRRNAEIALSIAPSPPMTSSATFQQHLTSPSSLTNRTSPKAANGSIHRRDVSLTTACMHGSSSSNFFAAARRRPSTDVINGDQSASSAPSTTNAVSKQPSKIDKISWSGGNGWKTRKRSPSDEGPSPGPSGSKRSLRIARQAGLAIATACLGPFCGLIFPEPSRSTPKSLSKSNSSVANRRSASNGHTKWLSTIFRTLLGIFLFYSLILFTSQMLVVPGSPPASTLKARSLMQTSLSEYSSWQQARFKLLDVYHVAADAIGSTASRMGRQTSKAAAGDFAGESNGANSLTNLMLLDRLPEVKRRWGQTGKFADKFYNAGSGTSNSDLS
jgi:hypothetical protein